MSELLLLFSDDLGIFPHFKVRRVDSGIGFPREAVAAVSLTDVSKQQPLLSCYPEKNVGTNPIRGDQGFQLWVSDPALWTSHLVAKNDDIKNRFIG